MVFGGGATVYMCQRRLTAFAPDWVPLFQRQKLPEIHTCGSLVGANIRSLRTYVILENLFNLAVSRTPHNKHGNAHGIGFLVGLNDINYVKSIAEARPIVSAYKCQLLLLLF